MADTVLVVDMLRGFLEKGYPLYIGDKSRQIIPNIQHLLGQQLA
jgi:nicotinamidase-related amidase